MKMSKHNIKLIIIDFYGMMSLGSYENTSHWIAKKYRLPFDKVYDVVYHKHFEAAALGNISERRFYQNIVDDLDLKENWHQIKMAHQSFHVLNKSVFNYCRLLQENDYTILLLSKNLPNQFREELKKMKIRKHFKNIINTYDLGFKKSSVKTIRYILKKFKVKPSETVFCDDQKFNLLEAKKLGVHTIYYQNFKKFRKDLGEILRNNWIIK